ncbi:hypothetical protein ACLI4Y_13215 [Natrialbaceae archaeon A-CW3]
MTDALARYLTIESEDDLTRVVFGVLNVLGPSLFAEILGLPEEWASGDLQIEFHTRIDPRANRIPDVVIGDGATTVIVEAKRGTAIDIEQLREEYADLDRYGNEQQRLIVVTGHESKPAAVDELDLDNVEWVGWRDIAIRTSNTDRSALSHSQRQLLDLLQSKLEEEGYMPFAGFSEDLLEELPSIWELSNRYYAHVARLYRALEGRLVEQGLQAKNVWRDGISQDFNRFPAELRFVSSNLWVAYGESGAEIKNKQHHYLFVAFCVEDGETPLVRVGYSVSPKGHPEVRETLIENAGTITEFLLETDRQLLYTDRNFHVDDRLTDESEMKSLLTAEDTLSNLDRVQLATEYGPDRLVNPNLTELVADDLLNFHEFVQSNFDH